MIIKELNISSFRNIENIKIFPSEEMNVIWGENAQGKTNLIEAIWLFTGAKSFRGAKEEELIPIGKEKASIKIFFIAEGVEKEAEILIDPKRRAILNGKPLKSASKLAGSFNAIVFSPSDLRLISDGPRVRRKFLDTAICQLYPAFIEILRGYTKAVTQRNKILRDVRKEGSLEIMLDVFEEKIALFGEKILKYRKRYIEILKDFLPSIYNGISNGKEILEMEYNASFEEGNLREELFKARERDIFALKTTVGPHRDDLEFKINGLDVRSFGSQGQKRSVALTLKLSEAEVIKKKTGESPICLLDDIMSELDPQRQNFILNHIKGMQTFISCCDPQNVKNLEKGQKYNISKGKLT